MADDVVDLATWPCAEQARWFGRCAGPDDAITFLPDPETLDEAAQARIEAAPTPDPLDANEGSRLDLVSLSCLPWLDYTALGSAFPGLEDRVPGVAWGRFTPGPDGR